MPNTSKNRKPGRKPGFSFGRPLCDKVLRVTRAHKERAAQLVTACHTADDILRIALEIGLREIEAGREKLAAEGT